MNSDARTKIQAVLEALDEQEIEKYAEEMEKTINKKAFLDLVMMLPQENQTALDLKIETDMTNHAEIQNMVFSQFTQDQMSAVLEDATRFVLDFYLDQKKEAITTQQFEKLKLILM